MAKLTVLREGAEIQSIDLKEFGRNELVVGRAPESDIRLEDRAVGRHHAIFLISSNGAVVIQKKSKFGKLSVNGAEVAEAPVKPGDVIQLADYLVRFEETAQAASQPAAPQTNEASAAVNIEPAATGGVGDGATAILKLPADGVENTGPALETDPVTATGAAATEAPGEPALEEPPADELAPEVDGGDRTAMISTKALVSKLAFKPGEANVEEYVIGKPLVTIGRGTSCDIVLADKKSSRKHLVIERVGAAFVAKDQGSQNGTYVNGVRINEQELAGDDVLRIGSTEFTFHAINQEYFDQQDSFVSPPPEEEPQPEPDPMAEAPLQGAAVDPALLQQTVGAIPGMDPTLSGVPGTDGAKKKETLLEKFKRQPKPRQIMIVIAIAGALAMMFFQEEEDPKDKKGKKPAQSTAATSADASFNALPAERKQFVVNTYDLVVNYYKNREYEKSLYEADKILQILPGGYRDTKEYRTYAQKSIEVQKANEEERKRKEAEERLRKEVTEFVAQAEAAVEAGREEEAKDLFAKVLERDPDNPTILRLRQTIEEKEAARKAALEAERDREAKRKVMGEAVAEGRALVKAGKYYPAIEKMEDSIPLFGNEKDMVAAAREVIQDARNQIKEKSAPHLQAGKEALGAGNYTAARDAFYRALKVDPRSIEAKRALDQIRETLRGRSQKIFMDALIAESLSDYRSAKARYKECIDSAMPDDKYFGMCTRKHKRLEGIDHDGGAGPSPASVGGGHGGGGKQKSGGGGGGDPEMPQLPASPPLE